MTTHAEPCDDVGGEDPSRLRGRLERERRARHEAERISERVMRDLYERQRELGLLVAVAQAANESSSAADALARAIAAICEYTGWPVGHVFLADPDPGVGLRPTAIWHLDDPDRHETFRRTTEATTLVSGQSLGGRVLETAQPSWLPDVTVDPDFAQSRLSADLGVRAGFGFPILIGLEVVGVMEFFSETVQPPDERLLELMAQIGTELGRAVERDRAVAAERALTRELAARAAELERSNSELAQFASIASHDLQEPLRKVRTFTHRVIETEADNLSERGRDYLERANTSAARMQTLVQDLLTFSRVATRGRPFAAVDLGGLVAEVLEDVEHLVERSGATVVVGELPTVDADALQMRQLMQNLITNALKFREESRAPRIAVDGAASGEIATISVTDNGIGFEPEYGDRIFRVFERLHGRSEYEGTGIGLALCRKIVERHGGTIDAEGVPGAGATFRVTMPLRQLAVAEADAPA